MHIILSNEKNTGMNCEEDEVPRDCLSYVKMVKFGRNTLDEEWRREREKIDFEEKRYMYSDAIFILATFLLYPSRLEFILSTCFTEKLFIQPCAYGSESYKPSKLRFHKNP